MSDHDARAAFESYLSAFVEPNAARREALMRANAHEDVLFSNPGVDGHGIGQLLDHMSAYQRKFPGGRFEIKWLLQQHGQVIAEWTQFHQDGSEFLTAHSYALIGEDGRITRFAGFWG